jgi:hypothetical protein
MLTKYRLTLAILCAIGVTLASSPFVSAGETSKPAKSVVEEVKKSCITGSLGVTLTNEYIFYGIVQDKDTLIAQPYLTLNFKLYEGEGFLNNVTFLLPLWASIHDINKPFGLNGPRSTTKDWYEFDIDPGLSFTLAKNWTVTISDFIFTSPGDYFDTSHNLVLGLSYDDSALLGAFALHPHFTFLQELSNHSGLLSSAIPPFASKKLGQYYELGIAPSYTFEKGSTYPVTVTLPATVGFGSNGYYGQGFGYFSIGATASVPLAFIPSCYGSWTTSLSGLYYRMGTNASSSDDPSTPFTYYTAGSNRPGRRDQGVVAWTIGTSF